MEKLAPLVISDAHLADPVNLGSARLRPNGWLRRAGGGSGGAGGLCARLGRELGRRFSAGVGGNERDSESQEERNAQQREPQGRGGLLWRRRRVMRLSVLVIVRFVGFFVGVAVAAHEGPLIFGFPAEVKQIPVAPGAGFVFVPQMGAIRAPCRNLCALTHLSSGF